MEIETRIIITGTARPSTIECEALDGILCSCVCVCGVFSPMAENHKNEKAKMIETQLIYGLALKIQSLRSLF